MKKIFFTIITLAGATQLWAQQKLNPSDSLLLKSPKNLQQFKLNDSPLFKNYFNAPKQNELALLNTLSDNKNTRVFYSHMPVLKVASNDKMPVVKGANIDNMPILKIKVIDPLAVVSPGNP